MDDLSYLAGIFDGEGSFSIDLSFRLYKTKLNVTFNPRATITLRDWGNERLVLKAFQRKFGGKIYTAKDNMVRWYLGDKENLEEMIRVIGPYLRIKKVRGLWMLKALSYYPSERKNHFSGQKSWNYERAVKVAFISNILNPPRKGKKTIDEVLINIKSIYGEKNG